MNKIYFSDKGIALMMVLILLVFVGGLSAILITFGSNNLRFSTNEVDRVQAFYAAESGIEHLKSLNSEQVDDLINNNNQLSGTLSHQNASVSYEVKHQPETFLDNDNKASFISVGSFNYGNTDIQKDLRVDIEIVRQEYSDKPIQVDLRGRIIQDVTEILQVKADELDARDLVYFGNYLKPSLEFWDSFDYDIIVDSEDKKNEYLSGNGNSINDQYETAFIKGDYTVTSGNKWTQDINNKIIFVDGDFRIHNQTKVENSIIITTGNLEYDGSPGGENQPQTSMFFLYDVEDNADLNLIDGDYNTYFTSNGNPHNWYFDNLPELVNEYDIFQERGDGSNQDVFNIVNWRPLN